jgi:hypothetical protein
MAREPGAAAESRTGSIRACGAPQATVRLGAARGDPARGSGLVTFGPTFAAGALAPYDRLLAWPARLISSLSLDTAALCGGGGPVSSPRGL